jgi:hypothetical protein
VKQSQPGGGWDRGGSLEYAVRLPIRVQSVNSPSPLVLLDNQRVARSGSVIVALIGRRNHNL